MPPKASSTLYHCSIYLSIADMNIFYDVFFLSTKKPCLSAIVNDEAIVDELLFHLFRPAVNVLSPNPNNCFST